MVKMPQRQRHNTGGGTGGADLPMLDPGVIEAHNAVTSSRCCVPLAGGCLKAYEMINSENPNGCVRVICNNDLCQIGMLMHRECFKAWEQHLLNFLRSCGRARSWSEKQRHQNLWTKRGYDLTYRACGCLCGRGHLRKDLNWNVPNDSDEENRNRRKKKTRNVKPAPLNVGPPPLNVGPANGVINGSQQCQRQRTNSMSSTGSVSPLETLPSPQHQVSQNNKKKEKNRHGSGGGGLFARRLDYSVFNALPKNKVNSYHIKMEDDGFHGNDETRCFILSTLAAHRISRTSCVLCHLSLLVFDRYPLIDGTFFLTPVQHTKNSIPVEVDGRRQFLSAICMGCLEGWHISLRCLHCLTPWDGSSLILGTMYSYDIFAAMPCCRERLQCSKCENVVIPSDQRLPFFSEFSRSIACPHCGFLDHHFVKSIQKSYYRHEMTILSLNSNCNNNNNSNSKPFGNKSIES